MTRPSDEGRCDLCGEPMPEGESMFRMHGYSGPCPKPPLPVTTPTHCACVWHGQADGPPFSECHYHATLRAELAAAEALLREDATHAMVVAATSVPLTGHTVIRPYFAAVWRVMCDAAIGSKG